MRKISLTRLICIIPLFGLVTFILSTRSESDDQLITTHNFSKVPSHGKGERTLHNNSLAPHEKAVTQLVPIRPIENSSEVAMEQYGKEILQSNSLCDSHKEYRDNDVVLAGSRPVGTYLCSYFPDAITSRSGCVLSCTSHLFDKTPFKCEIVGKASFEQLYTVDIMVNHHGPVPQKKNGKPYLTVFYSGESNASEGKKAKPEYQRQYDRTVSFHRFRRHYFTWTHRHMNEFMEIAQYPSDHTDIIANHRFGQPWSERKSAVAVFVSRCKGGRKRVIEELAKYYTVHSFGACARSHIVNREYPECTNISNGRYPLKNCVFKKYKFVLALENTRELDYVTEKVYHALLSGAVPLYDGAPNVDSFLPGGVQSVILMSNFSKEPVRRALGNSASNNIDVNFKDLSDHLKKIESDRDLQATLFRWRTHPMEWSNAFKDNLHHPEPTCDICSEAREIKRCSNI